MSSKRLSANFGGEVAGHLSSYSSINVKIFFLIASSRLMAGLGVEMRLTRAAWARYFVRNCIPTNKRSLSACSAASAGQMRRLLACASHPHCEKPIEQTLLVFINMKAKMKCGGSQPRKLALRQAAAEAALCRAFENKWRNWSPFGKYAEEHLQSPALTWRQPRRGAHCLPNFENDGVMQIGPKAASSQISSKSKIAGQQSALAAL